MLPIYYPKKKPLLRLQDGKEQIYCAVRKKWFRITPEEWVRQNFILFLTEVKNVPLSLIAVEKKVQVGHLNQRFDLVIFNRQALPACIVECKEQGVSLKAEVLLQVLRYNQQLQVEYLAITNGNAMKVFDIREGRLDELNEFPVLFA